MSFSLSSFSLSIKPLKSIHVVAKGISFFFVTEQYSIVYITTFPPFKLIYFNWRIITLQYCDVFVIHQHESSIAIHVSPHPEPPSHLPPYPIPRGCPRVSALGALRHVWNLTLVICFTYGTVHVSMLFSQIIPPTPPTESQSSLHLCFLCCPACRVVGTVFLNSIYMR